MVQLTEEIYSTLITLVPDVHFDLIDADFDVSKTHIIYEVSETESHDTLDGKNYANDVNLTIKVLDQNSKKLLQYSNDLKEIFLNQKFQYIRDISYKGSVPIFPDPDFDTKQLTLTFHIYYNSNVQGIPNTPVEGGVMTALEKLSTIEVGAQVNPTAEEIASAYHTIASEFTATDKADIAGLKTSVAGKADQVTVDGIAASVTTNTSDISLLKTGKADQSTLDNLSNIVGTNQSDITTIKTALASDNTTLDTFQEVVDFIQLNRTDLNTYVSGLENKVDKVVGKSLIADTDITKLAGVQAGATQNQTDIQSSLQTGNSRYCLCSCVVCSI